MGRSLLERLEARRDAHLERSRTFRVLFALAGFIVLLAGIALLVLPGPGWAVIAVALAMLALEFAWAERLLRRALVRLEAAQRTASRLRPLERALVVAALALAGIAGLVVVVLWDLPLVPF